MADITPDIIVIGRTLHFAGRVYPCAVGKEGFTDNKHELDGKTPTGTFALRECWYRSDRLPHLATGLPMRVIQQDDGWCDDPVSLDYNKHVHLPYPTSAEHLWREEGVYDVVIPLGYNDDPVVPKKGSAIFLHIAKDGMLPTEGCVALSRADLLSILPQFKSGMHIEIREI